MRYVAEARVVVPVDCGRFRYRFRGHAWRVTGEDPAILAPWIKIDRWVQSGIVSLNVWIFCAVMDRLVVLGALKYM